MLAGISAEYYLRLERGRAQHPSPQILDALARALKLDIKATKYLHQLASPTTSRWDQSVLEVAAEGLDRLIDQCPFPAIVASRYQDVLAANPIARALSPGFAPGQNFLRWRLLDPAARKLYVDWDEATDAAVSGLRECAGIDPHDPRMQKLIAELSMPAHVSANCGRAQVWVTRWESCACVIRRSATFIFTGTSSTFRMFRTPRDSICSFITPTLAATPPKRWRNSGSSRRRSRVAARHSQNRHLASTKEIQVVDLLNAVLTRARRT